MKKYFYSVMWMVFMTIIFGCAPARKMQFHNLEFDPGLSTNRSLAVCFSDEREEVLKEKRQPGYCGYIQSGYLVFPIYTQSGNALSNDFTRSLARSISARDLMVPQQSSLPKILEEFVQSGRERLLLFTILDWTAAIYTELPTNIYSLSCHFALSIYEPEGGEMARHEVAYNSKHEAWDITLHVNHLQAFADAVFAEQMRDLLSDDSIRAALK